MEDDIDAIIEQQRQLAAHRHQAYMTNPDFRDSDGQRDVSFSTVLIYAHLQNNGYLESFTESEYWSISTFAEELREFVERQLVEGVNRESGGLVLGLAFNAIQDVDWMEMAAMARAMLAERTKRQLEFAGTEVRLIPRLETIELDPDEPYSGN